MNPKIKKKLILGLQVLALLAIYPLFFTFIPWASSDKIDKISESPEISKQYPPPAWAKYFDTHHGKVTYFKDSPREAPLRAILHGGAILGCVLFLIISGLYSGHIKSHKSDDLE